MSTFDDWEDDTELRPAIRKAAWITVAAVVLSILVLATLGTGCAHVPPAPPPGAATCATACERARVLGCPHGQPTPRGATCETVCQDALATGLVVIDVECRTQAASCAAAEKCER